MYENETYKKARKRGIFHEYEGMFHTFAMFPIPEGFRAVREIASTIKNSQQPQSLC